MHSLNAHRRFAALVAIAAAGASIVAAAALIAAAAMIAAAMIAAALIAVALIAVALIAVVLIAAAIIGRTASRVCAKRACLSQPFTRSAARSWYKRPHARKFAILCGSARAPRSKERSPAKYGAHRRRCLCGMCAMPYFL